MMGNKAAFLSSHSSKDGFSCSIRLRQLHGSPMQVDMKILSTLLKKGYLGIETDNEERLNSFVEDRPSLLEPLFSDLKHETL